MYRYQQSPYGAPAVSTASLLGQVLGITGAGFLITAVTSYVARGLPFGASLLAMLVGFGFLIGISAARRNPALSLVLFYAFAACEGIGIGPVIAQYVRVSGSGVVGAAPAPPGGGPRGSPGARGPADAPLPEHQDVARGRRRVAGNAPDAAFEAARRRIRREHVPIERRPEQDGVDSEEHDERADERIRRA
ncbi:MAG: hypothetical protein NVS3B16_25700 [Vulcanimicrobiaceae bacterium]